MVPIIWPVGISKLLERFTVKVSLCHDYFCAKNTITYMTLTGCIVIAGLLLILIATLIYSWKVAGAVQSKLLKAANSVGAIFWFMGAWDFVEMMVRSVYPSGLGFIAMALGFLTCGTALLVGLLIKKKDESDRC